MQSHRPVDMARSRTLRRLPALLAFSLLALLLMAPSAFAWHGYLRVVKNVEDANSSRKAAASFTFKMERKDTPSSAWTAEGSPYSLSNGGVWVTPAGGWATGGDTASIPWKQWKVTETGAGAGYSLSDYETSMVCDRPYKGDNTSLTGSLWSDLFYSWGAWPAPTYDAAARSAITQLRWGNNYSYVTKCTFTNKRKPTIKIKKVFPNDPMGETQKVTFTLAGNAVTTSGGQSDFVNNSITNAIPLATNAPAPVIAEASTSIDLSKYTKTIDCTDASSNWTYKTTVDAANGSWTLPAALTPGQDVTCVVTNTRKAAKVKVIKYTDPVQNSGFDLQVDDVTKATNVGNTGTTGWVWVDTGSHAARETATGAAWAATIPGWSSKYACAVNPTSEPDAASGAEGTASGNYTLGDGDKLVCVFRNTKDGKIRVVKQWEGPTNGETVELNIDGNAAGTATAPTTFTSDWVTVPGGSTHSYGESALDQTTWQTTDLGCKNGADQAVAEDDYGKVPVGAGEEITCTIKNRRKSGTVKIVKYTNPIVDNGFDLKLNGETQDPGTNVGDGGSTDVITVPAGVEQTVSEAVHNVDADSLGNYDKTYVCSNQGTPTKEQAAAGTTGFSTTVTVADGQDVVCAFLNTRKSTFKVVKKFVGPSGTDTVGISIGGLPQNVATPDTSTNAGTPNFGDGDGTETMTVSAGATVEFSENAANLDAYTPTADCTNGAPTGAAPQWSAKVGAGENVVCTITNTRKTGKITLKKLIVPSTDTGQFILNAGSNATEPLGNNGSRTFDVPTGSYALTEGGAPGTDASDYVLGEPSCSTPVREEVLEDRAGTIDVPVVDGKVTVGEGADITCTWTNTRKGKVIVKKVAVNAAGTAPVAGTFAFTGGLGALNVAANGDGVTTSVAPNASYGVTETVPAGYTLTKVECVDTATGEGTASSTDLATATATANVQPGETVTCTFTNTQKSTPPGGESAGVGASGGVAPVGASGGAVKKRGTAKISGTVGCAASTYASASVSGKQIRRVTFYVNGKKVKTLTKANAGTAYRLQYRTKSLKVGAYKVRAKVEFTTASGTKAKTLSLQFSRCKPRVVKPQFTG